MLQEYTKNISLDALLFFATHALLVVVLCAVVFFTTGLLVGYYTWAKFKRRARAYYEELQIQRSEIAKLKRLVLQGGGAELIESQNEAAPEAQVEVLNRPPPQPLNTATSILAASVLREVKAAPAPSEMMPFSTPVAEAKPVDAPILAPVVAEGILAKEAPVPEVKAAEEAPAEPMVPAVTAAAAPKVGRSLHTDSTPQPSIAEAPSAVQGSDLDQALRSGQASMDMKLGIVYHARPQRFDDLTLLRGVGEALHVKLRENGIYSFRQIALWSEENIHEFDIKLAAKDRIRREQWVRQARNLHFLKYGEQLKAPTSAGPAQVPQAVAV